MKRYTPEQIEAMVKKERSDKNSSKKKMKEVKQKVRAVKDQMNLVLQNALNDLLDMLEGQDIDSHGLTLDEIGRKIFGKAYVTAKERRQVYRMINLYRHSYNKPIICKDRKYGWASNFEELELYYGDQARSAYGKLKSCKKGINANAVRLGISVNAAALIEDKRRQVMPEERII